jgi:hypothetical protein
VRWFWCVYFLSFFFFNFALALKKNLKLETWNVFFIRRLAQQQQQQYQQQPPVVCPVKRTISHAAFMVKSRETCSGASSSHNVSAGRGASFKAGSAHRPVAPKLSVLADAFFSGKIRDNTTPAACNAAKKLAILGNKNKNPEWSPLDSKASKSRAYFTRIG